MKIVNILGIVMSFCILPFQIKYTTFEVNILNVTIMSLVSLVYFYINWKMLIKTNNPNYRYNIFTLNPNWESSLES